MANAYQILSMTLGQFYQNKKPNAFVYLPRKQKQKRDNTKISTRRYSLRNKFIDSFMEALLDFAWVCVCVCMCALLIPSA